MEELRNKIRRIGALTHGVSTITYLAPLFVGIASVACALAVFFELPVPEAILERITSNRLFDSLDLSGVLDGIDNRYLLSMQVFTFGLSQLVAAHLMGVLRAFTKGIARGSDPFDAAFAHRLRRSLWQILPLALWSPAVAVAVSLFSLLVSYLIEYGAYLQEQANQTSRIQEEMIVSFAEITENKSGQTGQHIRRVAEYTRILAQQMGLNDQQVEDLRLASTMHDIGKLLVPSSILDKPGRLTDEEFAVIRQHTTYGGQLLENVEGDVMALARTVALDHHERWDGRGYAQGKAAEQISLEGRIVAVADVYDALTSRRSYKDAWNDREAYDEIVRCSGTQFDPAVVEAFVARYDDINRIRKELADAR